MVDSNDTAVIKKKKNNKPEYVLVDYNALVKNEQAETIMANQASVDEVASSVLSRHLEAFKELAK